MNSWYQELELLITVIPVVDIKKCEQLELLIWKIPIPDIKNVP